MHLGAKYVGGWARTDEGETRRHGYGVITYPDDKKKYEGEWSMGFAHGKGKYTYSNGDVYEGNYVDDKKHGYGVFTFSNGTVYKG